MTDEIRVSNVQPITPQNAALYEAGKKLLVDSVEVGREFCKFMVGVATGAIATYLALVGLAVGKDYRPSVGVGALLLVPPVLFLAAAGVFALGYFPLTGQFSLDVPDEIERARARTTKRRYTCALIGMIVFGVAVLGAIAGAVYGLTIKT